MASSERQSSRRSPNLPLQCQKSSCRHRDCARRGSSHTCPTVFWCSRCTRLWCEDCWDLVDAHEQIQVKVAGMEDHKKSIPKLAGTEAGGTVHPKPTSSEDPTKHLLMTQQEQPPNSVDQTEQGMPKRCQTEPSESPTPVIPYQVQLMMLEQQNKARLLKARQELGNMTQAPRALRPSPNSADQMEQGKTELSGPPTPVGVGQNLALEPYQVQLMILEQQNKSRLMNARQELENLK